MAVRATEIAMPGEGGEAEDRSTLGGHVAAIRRYWWVVATVMVLALVGALMSTAIAPTTYTGRTSLIVSSNDRSPEQDAVLVQGYVSYFDNQAYQQQLLTEARVDVTSEVTAQAAAASPILVITATAADPASAQAAAIAVGTAFRDDINEVHARNTAATLATLQNQLDTALARNARDDQAVIASLQDRIRELQADQDNVLQELQSRGGVTAESPSLLNNLVLGLVGGLLLGVLLALALARLSPRLRTREDVAQKLGLATLVEIPVAGTGALRHDQRMRLLANLLRAKLGGRGVVAVTQADDDASSWVVAHGLAVEWANQGYATVLVRFGGGLESPQSRVGESVPDTNKPEASATLSRLRPGPVPGLSIMDMRLRLVGGATTLPAAKVADLLELDPFKEAFVVIETSAFVDSTSAQAVSLVADTTVFVIDTQVATVTETREALGALRQSGVLPLGAVLAPGAGDEANVHENDPDQRDGAWRHWPSENGSAGWSW
jgi:capsular polysaccharide biosynthesis protein